MTAPRRPIDAERRRRALAAAEPRRRRGAVLWLVGGALVLAAGYTVTRALPDDHDAVAVAATVLGTARRVVAGGEVEREAAAADRLAAWVRQHDAAAAAVDPGGAAAGAPAPAADLATGLRLLAEALAAGRPPAAGAMDAAVPGHGAAAIRDAAARLAAASDEVARSALARPALDDAARIVRARGGPDLAPLAAALDPTRPLVAQQATVRAFLGQAAAALRAPTAR